jgi:DNA (cytosine-5)-methyltransferase 1
MHDFIFISLFAGCGGSSLGYKMAGGKELLAVEYDNNAVSTLRLNFPNLSIYHGDIRGLSIDDCLSMTDLKQGELDILDGSPPCQGFSTAGKRKLDDKRNFLFKEFIRFIDGLRPKIFIMENVTGLIKGYMKSHYLEICNEIRSLGYEIKGQIMNSMYYGVPQSRERVIIIGIRKDLNEQPSHPKPIMKPISVKKALNDIQPSEIMKLTDKYGKLWSKIEPGKSLAEYFEKIGKKRKAFSTKKLHPNKPSNTLVRIQTGRGFGTICHWKQPRAIAINEALILQSFPIDFKMNGTYQEKWAQIGNSVPPKLIYHIANHIKENILNKIRGKDDIITNRS